MPTLTYQRATNWWIAKDQFASFANYQILFASQRELSKKSRSASLEVAFLSPDLSQRWPRPAPAQLRAYEFFKANEARIADSVVHTLLGFATKSGYPKLKTLDELQQLVDIQTVYVLPVAKDRCAYLSLGFFCAWDPEHGVAVLLHRDRVVAVDADLGEQQALDDGGTRIRKTRG